MACLQQRLAHSAFHLFHRPLLKHLWQFVMGMLTLKNESQRNQSWRNLQRKDSKGWNSGTTNWWNCPSWNWNKTGHDKINVPLALGLILWFVKWSVALAEFPISVPKRDWSWLILSIEQTRFPAFTGQLSHAVLDVKGEDYGWLEAVKSNITTTMLKSLTIRVLFTPQTNTEIHRSIFSTSSVEFKVRARNNHTLHWML